MIRKRLMKLARKESRLKMLFKRFRRKRKIEWLRIRDMLFRNRKSISRGCRVWLKEGISILLRGSLWIFRKELGLYSAEVLN